MVSVTVLEVVSMAETVLLPSLATYAVLPPGVVAISASDHDAGRCRRRPAL